MNVGLLRRLAVTCYLSPIIYQLLVTEQEIQCITDTSF